MKKVITTLLTLLLTISLLSISYSKQASNHVHADYPCGGQSATSASGTCPGTMVLQTQRSTSATCDTPGMEYYVCDTCGRGESVPIPATGHTWIERDRQNATCSEDGYVNYYCSNCQTTKKETLYATGIHTWIETNHVDATCKEAGYIDYKCADCSATNHTVLDALGHDYVKKVITKETCEEDGLYQYTCSRCKDSYQKTVKAIGHKYEETEHVDATCIEDGHITKICQNCQKEETEILKALGHKVSTYKTIKEATCTLEGIKSGICETCKEELQEIIPPKGHSYPNEWTIDEEATYFKQGQQSKTCSDCGDVITETIAKKEIPTAVYATTGGITAGAIALFAIKKLGVRGAKKATKTATKKTVKEIAKEAVEKELLEPSFEEKTIVTCMKVDAFYKSMKAQKYLVIVESEYEELATAIEENAPSLTLIDVSEKKLDEVKENIEAIQKENEEALISLLISDKQLQEEKEFLEKMKEETIIQNYSSINANYNLNLVKLVLPVMKPDLKSDEGLENIGMVADALNIPCISSLIDLYINGRDIKTTMDEAEDGLTVVDKATIISDLASILGLEKLASVSGLIVDADDIKSSLEAKIGANEAHTAKDALTDIGEVVSDIIEK